MPNRQEENTPELRAQLDRGNVNPMPNDLIAFWQQCEIKQAPFAHPADVPILRANSRWIEADAVDFDSYIAGPRFADPHDDRLHLSLLPVPYVGDLRKAEIVILLLNPGFGYSDYWAESHGPGFREGLEQNLRQSFEGNEFPFMFLDPKFCWHGGFLWWEKKLREVIREIAARTFDGNYREGLRSLSTKLACVELIPYHSSSFGEHRLIERLPSVRAAREFVRGGLMADAKANKRTVIVTRQVKSWGVKAGVPNLVIYEGGHTRGASLGPNSSGGKAILQRYGII
jgi:hypothetical protein